MNSTHIADLQESEVKILTKVLDDMVEAGTLQVVHVSHWGDYRGWYVDVVLPKGDWLLDKIPGSWGMDNRVHIEATGYWTKGDALAGILRVLPMMNPYLENNGCIYITCPVRPCEADTVRAEYLAEHLLTEHGWE